MKEKKKKELIDQENIQHQKLIDIRDNHITSLKNEYEKGKIENEKGAQQLIKELNEKHEKEIEDFKIEFEKKWRERNPGLTPEISDKIKIKEKLCKIKKLKEAEIVQEEIEHLKEKHLENWNTKIKQKTFEDELKNIQKRHKMEMDILHKKIRLYKDKFEVKMKNENNLITNKYNVKEKMMLNDFKIKQDKYLKYNH
jgi:Fe2+ transport system protein B